MKQDINDEFIIGYINNTLSNSDRMLLEKKMEQNAYVADRYLFLKNVATATELKAEANFRKKVKAETDQLEKEKFFAPPAKTPATSSANRFYKSSNNTTKDIVAKKPISRNVIGVLVALLLLALLGLNMMYSDSAIANDAMRDETMKSYATRTTATAATVESTDRQVYQNAIQFYQQGNFASSYQALTEIKSTSPMYDHAQYAMALINYYQGAFEAAIKITNQLTDADSKVKDKAGWLEVNAAIQRFGYESQLISDYLDSNPSTYYMKKAKALQSEMEAPIRNFVIL